MSLFSRQPPASPRSGGGLSRRNLFGLGLSRLVPDPPETPAPPATATAPGGAWFAPPREEVSLRLQPAAEALADICGIFAGQRVLDVGAGDGNLALAAARRGAEVTACDPSPAAVTAGRARTQREGLAVRWVAGDVEALPFPDHAFDCVASSFGAMFAPDPKATASELFRVAETGGIVGLATWASTGFMGALLDALGSEFGAAPSARPSRWGREETLAVRLSPFAETWEAVPRTLPLAFPSADVLWDFFATPPGPLGYDLRELEPDRARRVEDVLAGLVGAHRGGEGPEIVVEADYLLVIARRPDDWAM